MVAQLQAMSLLFIGLNKTWNSRENDTHKVISLLRAIIVGASSATSSAYKQTRSSKYLRHNILTVIDANDSTTYIYNVNNTGNNTPPFLTPLLVTKGLDKEGWLRNGGASATRKR